MRFNPKTPTRIEHLGKGDRITLTNDLMCSSGLLLQGQIGKVIKIDSSTNKRQLLLKFSDTTIKLTGKNYSRLQNIDKFKRKGTLVVRETKDADSFRPLNSCRNLPTIFRLCHLDADAFYKKYGQDYINNIKNSIIAVRNRYKKFLPNREPLINLTNVRFPRDVELISNSMMFDFGVEFAIPNS